MNPPLLLLQVVGQQTLAYHCSPLGLILSCDKAVAAAMAEANQKSGGIVPSDGLLLAGGLINRHPADRGASSFFGGDKY